MEPQNTTAPKKRTKYDYLLQLYTGGPNLEKPFTSTGGDPKYCYASNSFALIRMPKEYANVELAEGTLEVEKIFNSRAELTPIDLTWSVSDLLGILSEHGVYTDRLRKCRECSGFGQEECFECRHMRDCETCDGSGKVGNDTNVIKSVTFTKSTLTVDGYKFTADYLHHLVLVAAILGRTEFVLRVRGQMTHATFGDVDVLTMLCN